MTEQKPDKSPDEIAQSLAAQHYETLHGKPPPPATRISRGAPAARHAAALANTAMGRELHAIYERDGAEAALGHANGATLAACMFVAFDLGQPDVARSTIDYWAERLAGTMPVKPTEPTEPTVFDKGPEATAAKWAEDMTDWLWNAHRRLDPAFSTTLAAATVRAGLAFLVNTYKDAQARALVSGLRAEVDAMVAARDAPVRAPRQ